jgi:hypothetical protein
MFLGELKMCTFDKDFFEELKFSSVSQASTRLWQYNYGQPIWRISICCRKSVRMGRILH